MHVVYRSNMRIVNMKRGLLGGILTALLTIPVLAQTTFTWTGLGADNNFETPANWQGGVAPSGLPTDNLVFGVSPRQSIAVNTAFTTGSFSFNGILNGYYFYPGGGNPAITLSGDMSTNSGVDYWGLFETPLVLAPGNHTFTTTSARIYLWGAVSGTGAVVKNGPLDLYLTQPNTYSGGTVINQGGVFVNSDSLGTGPVTFNAGNLGTDYTSDPTTDVVLNNNFSLGASPTFTSSSSDHTSLVLAGTLTALVPSVTMHLVGDTPLYLNGNIVEGPAGTAYTFMTDGTPGSMIVLGGTNTYTGGTVVKSGTIVRFDQSGSIPASGLITAEQDAYVGLGAASVTADTFISHLDPASFAGTIGFDNGYVYSGNIDLTNFSNPAGSIAIGTMSSATLTGAITPPATSGTYNFRSSGSLYLQGSNPLADPVSGSNGLTSGSFYAKDPGMLVLSQAVPNTYSGSTIADAGGIIFDSAGSLSAFTDLQLANGGYISFTDTSGLTLADLVSKVSSVSNYGVLGIDTHNSAYGIDHNLANYSTAVDFSSLFQPVYLGTVSSLNITGTITTSNDNSDDYFFTGYNGGWLKLSTQLTGSRQVHAGLPNIFQDFAHQNYSTVELANTANNYTGGTVLNSGLLVADNPLVLGAGNLTVDATASDGIARLRSGGNFAANIVLQSGELNIDTSSSLNLSGVISGPGNLSSSASITLSGNNTYSGGNFFSDRNTVFANSNTALGTGSLALDIGAHVNFSTAAPVVGSLIQGDPYTQDGTIYAALVLTNEGSATLTINQTQDGYFGGAILQNGATASVVKTGPATLTLGGDHGLSDTVYTGGTTILQGKLVAGSADAFGPGAITINGGTLGTAVSVVLTNPITFGASGGTLGGNGTIAVPITVGTNVILSPGDSPGTLTFASGLTLAPGGELDFQVQSANGAAGSGYDLVNVSAGLLNITATSGTPFTIKLISLNPSGTAGNVSDFSLGNGYSWMLFTGNSENGLTGFAADKFVIDTSGFTNSFAGGSFSLMQGVSAGNPALFLNFTPVPEPSTHALMLAGLAAVAWRFRRRR